MPMAVPPDIDLHQVELSRDYVIDIAQRAAADCACGARRLAVADCCRQRPRDSPTSG